MVTQPDTIFSKATDQISADMNGDVAILNLQTKAFFGVAGVAAFIWHQLDEPTDFEKLVTAVVNEFEVEPAQCIPDIAAFLTKLIALGLLNTHANGS